MSTDPRRWARFIATGEGRIALADQDQGQGGVEAAAVDGAVQEQPEPPKLEPAKAPMPGRLGDRHPEFKELSDELAEINRRSRSGRHL